MSTCSSRLALLNIAHLYRSPKRQEGAAIRILGIFDSAVSLQQHALKHYASSGLDIIAIPLQKWAAVLQHTQGTTDELAHLEALSRAYKERERQHEEEFRNNVSTQRTGDVQRALPNPEAKTAKCAEGDEAPPVSRDAELRRQKYAIISILPDVAEEKEHLQEPGIIVWDVFDTEEEAREHIKDRLATTARDVHLDTVAMYEWLPLTGLDLTQIKEEFRDSSLTNIIQARKDESRQVEQYRTLCEQRGQKPAVVELPEGPVEERDVLLPAPLEHQTEIPNLLDASMQDMEMLEHAACSA
jgi:hypothetical protein